MPSAPDRRHTLRALLSTVGVYAFGLLSLLSACSTRAPVPDTVAAPKLGFIEDFAVGRQEVVDRLGSPSTVMINGTTLIYYIVEDNEGYLHVTASHDAPYQLVLVFGENDRLRRHSLIRQQ